VCCEIFRAAAPPLNDFRQVHAVGLYGPRGAGVAEHLDYEAHKAAGQSGEAIPGSVMDRVDIITGAFGSSSLLPPIICSMFLQVLSARHMAPSAVTSPAPRNLLI